MRSGAVANRTYRTLLDLVSTLQRSVNLFLEFTIVVGYQLRVFLQVLESNAKKAFPPPTEELNASDFFYTFPFVKVLEY